MKAVRKVISTILVVVMLIGIAPVSELAGVDWSEMFATKASAISGIPSDAVSFNGHYYKVYDEGKSWSDAKTYCENLGGHLVTITSEDEKNFVTSLINEITRGMIWIGGYRSGSSFHWVTDEEWSYTNWNKGENEPSGDGDYIQMIAKTDGKHNLEIGAWNDKWNGYISGDFWLDCAFICEWDCNYSYFNGHRYLYFDYDMAWTDAKAFCETSGGHLVTIESEEEQTFVYNMFKDSNRDGIWLGLTDRITEEVYKWVTGEELCYVNWNNGDKCNSGILEDEDYIEMLRSNGKWNAAQNHSVNGFYRPGMTNRGIICEWDESDNSSIAVFSTEKTFTVNTGESMWFAFGLIDNETEELIGDWKKMSIVSSNPDIIQLSDYEKTDYGYSLSLKGLKAGKTNLTVTDTDTGNNTLVTVIVLDKYNKQYSYNISNVASFYPDDKLDRATFRYSERASRFQIYKYERQD